MMAFKPQVFLEAFSSLDGGTAGEELSRACASYAALNSPIQKARCIHWMMDVLERDVDAGTRRAILQACGRRCIGASILEKAISLQKSAADLDDLIRKLNEAGIGGRRLKRAGETIQASYERCYCGSVSQTRELFSSTYCQCSCGWFRELFETLFGAPVEVELLGSIIQGDETCRFVIRLGAPLGE